MDPDAAIEGLRTRVQDMYDQGQDMDDLQRRAEELEDAAGRFKTTGSKPTTSSSGGGWFSGISRGSKSSGLERVEASGGEGSDFANDPDQISATDESAANMANVDRGLRVKINDDGSISFQRQDGKKYKRNWFWKSTSDHQEMNALNNHLEQLARKLSDVFRTDPHMTTDDMAQHLAPLKHVSDALNQRIDRLADHTSWFGGPSKKAEDARNLRGTISNFSYYDQLLHSLSDRVIEDHTNDKNAREDAHNAEQKRLEREHNAQRANWMGKLRTKAYERVEYKPQPMQGDHQFAKVEEAWANGDYSNAYMDEARRRVDAARQKLYGGKRDVTGISRSSVGRPEDGETADLGVPGKRTPDQMIKAHFDPERQQRIRQREREQAARRPEGGLLGKSKGLAKNAEAAYGGGGLSPEGQAAQDRLGDTDLGKGMGDRTDGLDRIGRRGQAMQNNAGAFGDAAGYLEEAMRKKSRWGF